MTDAELWQCIEALLRHHGVDPEDLEGMRVKFFAGRAEHGDDLAALDYAKEIRDEAYDLALYPAIAAVLHGADSDPQLIPTIHCAKLVLSKVRHMRPPKSPR